MIHKVKIALLLAALSLPGGLARATDEDPQPQKYSYSDNFFFSAGRSYLGVMIQDVTADRLSALKLKEERGVEVTMVDQDAPAGKAGLKEHDVILEYNGARVESEQQIRRMINETPPGRTATLGLSRDGAPMTLKVQIGDRAQITADNTHKRIHGEMLYPLPRIPELPEFDIDLQDSPVLGIQVDSLGRQLAEFFGVKAGEGLLVRSVAKGSAGEKAGLKAGDVITRVENEKTPDRSDLRRILRAHQGGKVTLGIVRDKREQNLTVDLPARKSRDNSSLEFRMPDRKTLDEIQERLRRLQPEIDRKVQDSLRDLQPQLLKARMAVNDVRPQVEEAMRKVKTQLEQARREFEQHQREWKFSFGSREMI